MMNMKRFLAICLSLCLILSLAPLSVFAVDAQTTDLSFEKLEGDYGLTLNKDVDTKPLDAAQIYGADDLVKVIIIMEEKSVMEAEIMRFMEKSMKTALDLALDDIFKDWK